MHDRIFAKSNEKRIKMLKARLTGWAGMTDLCHHFVV